MTWSIQPRQHWNKSVFVLKCPAQSTDSNHIEHLWTGLKVAVPRCFPPNLSELERICQKEWNRMPISRYAMFVETNPRRLIAVLVVLNKYHLTVHITDVSTKVCSAKFKSKHQKQNGCGYLFIHVFVCKPGASFFLSLARLTAVGPAGPRGRTWGTIWCQFIWCQQGKAFCFSISILTSGPWASFAGLDFNTSNETYCIVRLMHDNFNKSMKTVT